MDCVEPSDHTYRAPVAGKGWGHCQQRDALVHSLGNQQTVKRVAVDRGQRRCAGHADAAAAGHDRTTLDARHTLSIRARAMNPARWSGATRSGSPIGPVPFQRLALLTTVADESPTMPRSGLTPWQWRRAEPLAEPQRQATKPGLAVRGPFLSVRAWRLAVRSRLSITLGIATIPLACVCRRVSVGVRVAHEFLFV